MALVVGGAIGLVVAVRRAPFHGLGDVLRGADLRLLAVAAPILLVINLLCRSARFRILVDPGGGGARFRAVLASVLVSQAANNVLPLRAGDLLRTRDFVTRGYPISVVASAQVAEKSLELASLLAVTSPLLSRQVRVPGVGVVLLLVAVAAPIVWLVQRVRGSVGWVAVAARALAELLVAFLWSIAGDGSELVLIYLCLASLHLHAAWVASAAVLAGINVAIAIPATPANLGTFEAGAALGLLAVGVPVEGALGFAILYRVVQWAPCTLAGALVAWLRRRHGRAMPPPQTRGLGCCSVV